MHEKIHRWDESESIIDTSKLDWFEPSRSFNALNWTNCCCYFIVCWLIFAFEPIYLLALCESFSCLFYLFGLRIEHSFRCRRCRFHHRCRCRYLHITFYTYVQNRCKRWRRHDIFIHENQAAAAAAVAVLMKCKKGSSRHTHSHCKQKWFIRRVYRNANKMKWER